MRLGFLRFKMGLLAIATSLWAPSGPALHAQMSDASTFEVEQTGSTARAIPQTPQPQSGNSNTVQIPDAPDATSKPGTISGTVTDVQDEVVPGAEVTLQGPDPGDSHKAVANDLGSFQFDHVQPGLEYHLTIEAQGFVEWKSPLVIIASGEYHFVAGIRMQLKGEGTSVTVTSSPADLATEEVRIAEQQRVFGVIPNFYVAYDQHAPPLTAKTKYELALRVSYDPITIAGVLFLAGVNQGAELPDYRLGAMGYGERVGAVAADGFTDIFFGGAVLPSLLHQDPRYFYQGTGTTRSRLMHALAAPFVCRGDNGHTQPNYSTVGGDVISSAISNLYYPHNDRTGAIMAENVAISTLERTASTVTQEFVLRRLTSGAKSKSSDATDDQK